MENQTYQLELKQIVEFPRCRIYRDFIRSLITNKGIRTNGGSFLFYYIILCSYANYRSSYRRTETMTYLVGPGEWICTLAELRTWFRCRFQHQADNTQPGRNRNLVQTDRYRWHGSTYPKACPSPSTCPC